MSVLHCKAQAHDIIMHFAAPAQGFLKVTRLRRICIGICSFRVMFVCPEVHICDKSRVVWVLSFCESLVENARHFG